MVLITEMAYIVFIVYRNNKSILLNTICSSIKRTGEIPLKIWHVYLYKYGIHVYHRKLSILYKIDCVKSIYFIEKWVESEIL